MPFLGLSNLFCLTSKRSLACCLVTQATLNVDNQCDPIEPMLTFGDVMKNDLCKTRSIAPKSLTASSMELSLWFVSHRSHRALLFYLDMENFETELSIALLQSRLKYVSICS